MAMSLDTAIKFTAKLEGSGLDQLKRGLQGLAQQSKVSKRSLDQLYTATKALGSSSTNTIAGLQKTSQALRGLRDQAEFGSRKFRILTKDIADVEQRLKRFQGVAEGGGGLTRGKALLAGFAGGVAGSIATAAISQASQLGQGVLQVGLQAEGAQVRLKALADEFGEYNQAQEATARIAKTLRISNTEAQESFASLYASLRPTGVALPELEKAFIGFSAAARNSGATAQETSNALIQLKQGLASGVLQGEELRSIREQAPLAAAAIAKELGVSIGELKGLAAEGKVTTDVVLSALGKLQDTQLGKLNQQFNTGQQAIKDFQIAGEQLGLVLARVFGPTAVSLLRNFTGALQDAADIIGTITGDGEAGRRAQLRVRAQQQAARETDEKFGSFSFDLGGKNQFFLKRQQEIYAQLEAADRRRASADVATADQREAREAAAAERQAGRDRARAEALKEQLKVREDMEEKLADAAQKRAQELADFQKESIRRAAQLERDLGDQRLQVERSISEARRRIAEQEQDIALEQEKQRLRAAGLSTEGVEAAGRINEIFRRYSEQRIQNEQNATDRQTDLQRRLEEFKIQTADGIGRIQEGYARSVSNILQDAGKKLGQLMEAGAQNAASTLTGAGGAAGGGGGNATIASIADTSLNANARAWLAVIRAAEGTAGPNGYRTMFGGGLFSDMSRHPDRVVRAGGYASAAAGAYQFMPDTWRGVGGGPMTPIRQDRAAMALAMNRGVNLSTAPFTRQNVAMLSGEWASLPMMNGASAYGQPVKRFDALSSVFSRARGTTPAAAGFSPTMAPPPAGFDPSSIMGGINSQGAALGAAFGTETAVKNQQNFNDLIKALRVELGGMTADLDGQTKSTKDQLADTNALIEAHRAGLSPELAQQTLDVQRAALAEAERLDEIEFRIAEELRSNQLTEEQRVALESVLRSVQLRRDAQPEIVAGIQRENVELERAKQNLEAMKARQQELQDLYANIKGTLAQGVIGGIDAAIEAAMTGAKDLDDQLKQIAAGVLKQIGSALIKFGLNSLFPGFGFANGGVMTNNGPAPLKRYSQGGIANRPQLALYGEGSKPEAYVPLPDGRRIPVALQGDKMRDAMGSGPMQAATSPVLNMSFQSTNIGGVEYVSRDQLESAMAATRRQAARDGAKRGMSMTLDKLQQSPSTRSRVGLR